MQTHCVRKFLVAKLTVLNPNTSKFVDLHYKSQKYQYIDHSGFACQHEQSHLEKKTPNRAPQKCIKLYDKICIDVRYSKLFDCFVPEIFDTYLGAERGGGAAPKINITTILNQECFALLNLSILGNNNYWFLSL